MLKVRRNGKKGEQEKSEEGRTEEIEKGNIYGIKVGRKC